ncbi:MAG: HAD family hydrolase [Novosphingobium meiothermophilum]
MTRPLIVSDCDEVLLHMVAPFRDWLGEKEGVSFRMDSADFSKALRYIDSGDLVPPEEIWNLLNRFFDTEMHRQQAIAGAVAGINTLGENADIVILTNLNDHRREMRARQLADVGIKARVFTNQGPKGPALKAILDEYRPNRALFIDDLPQHHDSVSQLTPEVLRLHLCGEPLLAPHIDCAHQAGHAHARIDQWEAALPWIIEQLHGEDA